MRACIQRVTQATVTVDSTIVGSIDHGLVILLGVAGDDTLATCDLLADKIAHLRIFDDAQGKMNRSLLEVGGAALVVSQFTLFADCRKGRRPSFTNAAPPDHAEHLYLAFAESLGRLGIEVARGKFRATMQVALVNDGPVTVWLEL